MASISNRQKTYTVLAILFLITVMLFLTFVVAPFTPVQRGWLVIAFLVISGLICFVTIYALHRADAREQAALKTVPPSAKKS